MNTFFQVIIAAMFAGAMHAQTNATGLVTNYVTAAEHFRRVDGKLYNTEKSALWTNLVVQVMRLEAGFARVQMVSRNPVYENRWNPRASGGHGSDLGGGQVGGWRRVQAGEEKVFGKTLFIRNPGPQLSNGDEVTFRAMRVGNATDGTELWDRGVVNRVQVVSTNRPAITH
jgi:hypothetical protein